MTIGIGTVLDGKYRLVRVLGEGGMGSVYEAEHTFLHRRAAIKVLAPEFSRSADAVKRFCREAQAAAQIGHDNICEVTDIGQTNEGQPYIVMPVLQGRSLSALLSEAKILAVGRAIDIAVQILEALSAAHAAGIVHRDMKPDNVFLTRIAGRDDFVKVLDFGISKVRGVSDTTAKLTQAGTVLGTPAYMSPEQARGETDIDERVDIWAVGVMLHEMLVGGTLFPGDNYNKVLFNVLTVPIPPLRLQRPDAPPALEAAVAGALERDVARRFRTAQALREALLGAWVLEEEPQGVLVSAAPAVASFPPPQVSPADVATRTATPLQLCVSGASVPGPTPRPGVPAGGVVGPGAGLSPPAPVPTPSRLSPQVATIKGTPAAIAARSLTPPVPVRTRSSRNPVTIAAIAGGVLVAGALLVVLVGRNGSSDRTPQVATTSPPARTASPAAEPPAPASVLRSPSLDAGVSRAPPPADAGAAVPPPPALPPVVGVPDAGPPTVVALGPADGDASSVAARLPERDSGGGRTDTGAVRPQWGTLSVTTMPRVEVYFDATPLGWTPFTQRQVPAGLHTLTFVESARGLNRRETVEIAAGRETAVRRTPEQLGLPAALATTPSTPDAGARPPSVDAGVRPPPVRDAGPRPADAVGIRIRTRDYGRETP